MPGLRSRRSLAVNAVDNVPESTACSG